jgi:hypothetical protein
MYTHLCLFFRETKNLYLIFSIVIWRNESPLWISWIFLCAHGLVDLSWCLPRLGLFSRGLQRTYSYRRLLKFEYGDQFSETKAEPTCWYGTQQGTETVGNSGWISANFLSFVFPLVTVASLWNNTIPRIGFSRIGWMVVYHSQSSFFRYYLIYASY